MSNPQDYAAFLADRRVVIADSGKNTGRAIRKLVMQMGAKPGAVVVVETFDEARTELRAEPTAILFCEMNLKEANGIDLIAIQESKFPNRLEIASILISSELSKAQLGSIADSRVDSVLIKPFTAQTFAEAFSQAVDPKLVPSAYLVALETGKALQTSGNLDEAAEKFKSAQGANPKAGLPYFYLGKISETRGDLEAAMRIYEAGLQVEPKQYQCLSALFYAMVENRQHSEAYELAKLIHRDYPVSNQRILDLVKLSVAVRKFDDIEDYYEIFKKVENAEPALAKVVVAGTLICAKYAYLMRKNAKSLEIMKKAATSSRRYGLLQKDVFRHFIETKHFDEAEEFFSGLDAGLQQDPQTRLLCFDLLVGRGKTGEAISEGLKLVHEKITSPQLYQVLIDLLRKEGSNPSALGALVESAKAEYPERKDLFS